MNQSCLKKKAELLKFSKEGNRRAFDFRLNLPNRRGWAAAKKMFSPTRSLFSDETKMDLCCSAQRSQNRPKSHQLGPVEISVGLDRA
jgi:hypothetical protein